MATALQSRTVLTPEPPYNGMRVSEEQYFAHYYEGHDQIYEWNDGVLEEKGMSDAETSLLFHWFLEILSAYLRSNQIAELYLLDIGFKLPLASKRVIRRPDLGIVRRDNPIIMRSTDRTYRGIYDLCIEGLSDSTAEIKERDTIDKVWEYAQIGVSEYYILHRNLSECKFYRINKHGHYQELRPSFGGMIRSEVLPGFQWRKKDLGTRPPLEDLVDDPIYRHYVASRSLHEARKLAADLKLQLQDAALLNAEFEQRATERVIMAEQQQAQAEQQTAEEAQRRIMAEQQAAEEAQQRIKAEQRQAQAEQQTAEEAQRRIMAEQLQALAEQQAAEEARLRSAAEQQIQRMLDQLRALGIETE